MSACMESPSTIGTTIDVIQDPETLARVLKEVLELLYRAGLDSQMLPSHYKRSLLRGELRVLWLLLNLCSPQLGNSDWVSLHSRTQQVLRDLSKLPLGGP